MTNQYEPTQPAQQPQPGQPPQPPYGTHHPYSAPSSAQYPPQAGYPAPGQVAPPAQAGYVNAGQQPGYGRPVQRSGVLGMVGLAMVTIAGVAACVLGYLTGTLAPQIMDLARASENGSLNASDPQMQALQQQNPWLMLSTPVMLVGLAGFIVSIVAVASRRGRTAGIWGIVLGVLLPIASVALMVATMASLLR